MNLKERISLFSSLGNLIADKDNPKIIKSFHRIKTSNPWFTDENISLSLSSVSKMLNEEALIDWTSKYDFKPTINEKKVFIIMAGNLPLVGFHDFLSVLISGNVAVVKLSSKDNILPRILIELMISIDSRISDFFNIVDNIIDLNVDAVIATGSDNSSKYFDYYFKGFKSIIRKNRRSLAILDGSETESQLESLADDVFSYFGLGCRSVSKIYIPVDYDLNKLFKSFFKYNTIINHIKYANNYDYNKTIYLMNKENLLDNGFVIFKEDQSIQSPVATIFYEYYNSRDNLNNYIKSNRNLFQCIVSNEDIPFGQSQFPKLTDYADQKDTIEFLLSI
jgi:hypothetical protein